MKCKYWNICPRYKVAGICCNKNKLAQNFYGKHKPAGCYKHMEGK